MNSSTPSPPSASAPRWKRALTRLFQIAITCISLLVLGVTYIKWDSQRLAQQIAQKVRLSDGGKGFRELAPPVVPETSNFCSIPCLKDSAGGTGSHDRDEITRTRVQDFIRRLKVATDDVKATDLAEKPEPTTALWAKRLTDRLPAPIRDNLPKQSSPSATVIAATDALIPELAEVLEAANRPNAQWIPTLRIRKFKGPLQFVETQQPTVSLGLAKLLNALAIVYLEGNSPEKTADCLKSIIRIAEANLDEPLHISGLVAASVLSSAQTSLKCALSSHKMSVSQIEGLLACLQKIRVTESHARASRVEVAIGLEFVDSLDLPQVRNALHDHASNAYPALFAFSGALMKNLSLRALLEQVSPEAPMSSGEIPSHMRRIAEWQNRKHSPLQDLAERLYPMQIPRLSLLRTMATTEAQLRLSRLACAIELHRRSKSVLPLTLDELPPAIVADNDDPFATGPMHYRQLNPESQSGSFRLWSVGLDFTDENGEVEQTRPSAPPRPSGGDIVWNSALPTRNP